MIQIVLIKCIIYIFNRLLYDCVNSSIEVVNCQPAVPNIIVKYSSWLWFLFIPNTLNTKKTDSLVLSERCQGSKNGNNHPKVFLVFLRTTIKNELSRKIRGNRLVFQHVGELF
ncbi:unnamed protein product [Rhizophagus irregularis]|nr:unnamed protein product [Rhizophagus irregularis]